MAFAAGTVVAAGAAVSAGWQGRRAAVAWSAPTALAASTEYASAPRLAVGAEGRAVAAWFGGPPPPVAFARSAGAAGSADVQTWTGSKVLVAQGTTTGGFGTPVILDTHGNDTALQVALSGSGVAYVAWGENKGPPMITSSIAGGPFAAPHRLLPPGGSCGGSCAAQTVPSQRSGASTHPHPQRAICTTPFSNQTAHSARPVKIGPWHGPVEGTPFALNDHGEFAAVDMRGENEQGPLTPTPRVHMCDSVKGCAPSHPLQFARLPTGRKEPRRTARSHSPITAPSPSSPATRSCPSTPRRTRHSAYGMRSDTRTADGETHELALAGERPQVVSSGHASTTTLFDHFWHPKAPVPRRSGRNGRSYANERQGRPAQDRTRARIARPGDYHRQRITRVRGRRSAAGKQHQRTSQHPSRDGSCSHLGAAERVVSGEVGGGTPQAGIDDAGNAIILWIDFPHSGVFASLHRTR